MSQQKFVLVLAVTALLFSQLSASYAMKEESKDGQLDTKKSARRPNAKSSKEDEVQKAGNSKKRRLTKEQKKDKFSESSSNSEKIEDELDAEIAAQEISDSKIKKLKRIHSQQIKTTPQQRRSLKNSSAEEANATSLKTNEKETEVFYRTLDFEDIHGVYADKLVYNGIDLLSDENSRLPLLGSLYSQSKNPSIQHLMVTFFGVWSYSRKGKQENENNKEFKLIEVPISEIKNGSVNKKEDGKKRGVYPCLIWETGDREERGIDNEYSIRPCQGEHTEAKFKEFIKDQAHKKAIWEHFSNSSPEWICVSGISLIQRRLELVGFKFYSTKDACNTCFKLLHDSQSQPTEILTDLLPVKLLGKVPFQILYLSNKMYFPQNHVSLGNDVASDIYDNKTHSAGSSLQFYIEEIPDTIIKIYRLYEFEDYYGCSIVDRQKKADWENNLPKEEKEIGHQAMLQFNTPGDFIVLKCGEAKAVKVRIF